jgi:hypothetical protein
MCLEKAPHCSSKVLYRYHEPYDDDSILHKEMLFLDLDAA